MKSIKNLFIIIFFISSTFLIFPITGNITDSTDEVDEKLRLEWGNFSREIEIKLSTDRIEIDSILKDGATKDRIRYEIRTENDQIRIELRYSKEANNTSVGFKYRVEFDSIIEYVENGTEVGYQPGEETSIYTIGESGWTDFVRTTIVLNQTTNESVDLFNTATMDGIFNLTFKVADSILKLDNTILSPNSVKLDVEINNFPNTTVNSLLALSTKIKTQFEQSIKENTTEERLGLKTNVSEVLIGSSSDQSQGYFSWAENAVADGQIIEVHNSPLANVSSQETDLNQTEGEQSFQVFFSFLRVNSQNVYWDPTYAVVSVVSSPTPDSNSKSPSTSKSDSTPLIIATTPQQTSAVSGFEFWFIIGLAGLGLFFRRRRFI
ncbi:MAG: hypothetical protein HeimC3_14900 [Candidatus Heimdallarchaeota archaeon LC_3]|nr:MAG: hypothetical protein HeimC3_14900 [Candidatus Heimdallarchaeota archaeon LC_3]